MWGGELVAVLPFVAAGFPSMLTSLLKPPSSWPMKGCGNGVGTGPAGVGIIATWMSVATTWSPCFAAGLAIAALRVARFAAAVLCRSGHFRSGQFRLITLPCRVILPPA